MPDKIVELHRKRIRIITVLIACIGIVSFVVAIATLTYKMIPVERLSSKSTIGSYYYIDSIDSCVKAIELEDVEYSYIEGHGDVSVRRVNAKTSYYFATDKDGFSFIFAVKDKVNSYFNSMTESEV